MLVKITEPTFTVIFRSEDITRITPVLVEGELDFYYLELTRMREKLKLSIEQVKRLTACLLYVDLSIDLDEDKTELLEKPEADDFDRIMSDLLDMAIDKNGCSKSLRENRTVRSENPWLIAK